MLRTVFRRQLPLVILLGVASLLAWPAAHADKPSAALAIVQMADYIAVDYPQFMHQGISSNPAEYAEQLEFSQTVWNNALSLPEQPGKADLVNAAERLRDAVAAKSDPAQVVATAREVSRLLLTHYPETMSPDAAPSLARGAALYQENCVACHGPTGQGDGPASSGLQPPPSNFQDPERRDQRSLLSLYSTLTLGVNGTAMASYSQLSDKDRWALAYYIGQLGFDATTQQHGEQIWRDHPPTTAETFASLSQLAQSLPHDIRQTHGEDGLAVLAYLRAHPEALAAHPEPFSVINMRLAATERAVLQGNTTLASELALSAYLDGFELLEPSLKAVDNPLKLEIEKEMMALRQLVRSPQAATELPAQLIKLRGLLDQARNRLDQGDQSAVSNFVSSYLILAREGLEAILVLAAMFAFLKKSDRPQDIPYLHIGWIAALALGLLTWVASTYLINISGAQREFAEGATALLAAIVLLFVGLWLHNKSYAGRWQQYVTTLMKSAITGQGRWALTMLAFLTVYREAFETVLFYRAIWDNGSHSAVLLGIGAAAVTLAVLAISLFKFSVRLPITQFFTWSSYLIAVLAVVFIGNGIAGLQKAGVIGIYPINVPSIPLLGMHSNLQALAMQLVVLLLILGGFAYNHLTRDNRMAKNE